LRPGPQGKNGLPAPNPLPPTGLGANHIQTPKQSSLQNNNVIRISSIVALAGEIPQPVAAGLGLDDLPATHGRKPRRRFNPYIFSIKYIMFL
jgi:hypothetical protein